MKYRKEEMIRLTADNARSFVGKRIYFYSRQYAANEDAEGVSVIVSMSNERKLFQCEIVEGDSTGINYMNFAFLNADGDYCIGDSDRPVYVKEV